MAVELRIGCSGWYYLHWKGTVYPAALPSSRWFGYYAEHFNTVELNAPFYHWPKETTVKRWQSSVPESFVYSVKVNQAITHLKRFKGTKRLVGKFYRLLAPLGPKLGCVLFQLPPSFSYTEARLRAILDQLNPAFRNVIEFRHKSWWSEEVRAALERAGAVFCSVSAPDLPDEAMACSGVVYIRFHGAKRWYRYDYSESELRAWAEKVHALQPRAIWAYFNNDFQGCAFRNAEKFLAMLGTCFGLPMQSGVGTSGSG